MSRKLRITFCFALAGCLLCAGLARAEIQSTNLPARSSGKQALIFSNGDLLFGHLESINGEKNVTWKRGDVAQPMGFSGTNIWEIQFPGAKKAKLSATNGCRIELHNGDSLEGKLLQLNSKEIILETAFAGKMIFPRSVVKMLESLPPPHEPIFSGPTGVEGWTLGKINVAAAVEAGQWSYTNGAFYATRAASIARDVKLPDVSRVEFDLAWKGTLQAAIALYTSYMQPVNLATKDTDPDFGAFYSLQINSFVSTLMPVRKNEPLKYMGQIPVPAFSQKNHAHLEILSSKPKRSIALLVDGALVQQWVDTSEFAGSGTGMRFVHQGQGALKLSHLNVSEWNGKMESKSTNLPPFKENLAKLLNGDIVSGTLETFHEGKLSFSTANGKLDIPLERVSETFFKPTEMSSRDRTDIRAFFSDDDRVTFHLERWDDQGIVATSPNFGCVIFAPGTFERAQLNLNSRSKPTNETSR